MTEQSDNNTIFAQVDAFTALLGLPKGFFNKLLEEDDWSFVIKLSSLFEAACTNILAIKIGKPELADCLVHIDVAHTKFGKLAMLAALGAVTAEQSQILRTIAELRNKLVHNIAEVQFSFESYAAGLSKPALKVFLRDFGHGLVDPFIFEGKEVMRDKFIQHNAKVSLWLMGAELLACLHLEHSIVKTELERNEFAAFMKVLKSDVTPALLAR